MILIAVSFKNYTRNILIANMFRLDDRTDEGSQGIEERLRRGGLIRDEGRRTDRPPDPMQERHCSCMFAEGGSTLYVSALLAC